MFDDSQPDADAAAHPPPPPSDEPALEQGVDSIPPIIKEFQSGNSRPPILKANQQPRPGTTPVRWIMVILTGGCLGLLLALVASHTNYFANPNALFGFGSVGRTRGAQFKLTDGAGEKELQSVIESQLTAFREGDFSAAYGYAAAGLKAQVTLPAFERMVKTTYPAIAQSRSAEFGVSLDNGKEAVIHVTIVGRSGRAHHYEYILQREGDAWRISGVKEVPAEGTTA